MKKTMYRKQQFAALSLAAIFFFSGISHISLNIWEKPAIQILVFFLIGVPLTIAALFFAKEWIKPTFKQTNRQRLYWLFIISLIFGIFLSWQYNEFPVSYQTIEISATSPGDIRTVELAELKTGANNIISITKEDIEKAAWTREENIITSTHNAQPLIISFKAQANNDVTLLFNTSQNGGHVEASLGYTTGQVNTESGNQGQTTLRLKARYRNIPNILFVPFYTISNIGVFASLIFFIFLIQERGINKQSEKINKTVVNHRKNLIVLLLLALGVHLFNSLTTPLILDVDSPSYLSGAVYWLKHGNLSGASPARGIGSTFLFTPILFLFGRNPWGMKTFLHLIAIACTPLAYKIGWQLTKQEKIALMSGFITIFTPDILLYSNYLWSDLINLFAILGYTTLLLSALEKPTPARIFSVMFVASMTTLFRTEQITTLPLAAFFLCLGAFKKVDLAQWKQDRNIKKQKETVEIIRTITISLTIAAIPILLAAYNNQKTHGFFGLSNYAGEALYDGWIYFGDASNLQFSDQDSEAVKIINEAISQYPIEITDKNNIPTGWEIYPSLLKAGYSGDKAMDIFSQATFDSIQNDWHITQKVILRKISGALKPEVFHFQTLPLPGETLSLGPVKATYYDGETLSLPLLINIQRQINTYWTKTFYPKTYPFIVDIFLLALLFSFSQKPSKLWLPFLAVTITRIFIPAVMALSVWRYTLAGLIPLEIMTITWLYFLYSGITKTTSPAR